MSGWRGDRFCQLWGMLDPLDSWSMWVPNDGDRGEDVTVTTRATRMWFIRILTVRMNEWMNEYSKNECNTKRM